MRILAACCALFAVTSAGLAWAKDGPKLPSIEEGGKRAAVQDIVGNLCPGVQPDYTMRLVLVASLRDKDAGLWAKGYDSAARELLDILAKPEGRAAVCENALSLYGPAGSSVPKLLQKE